MDADSLISRFRNRGGTLCVVGLGYVGLPLSIAFAQRGFTVIGIDADAAKVDALNQGRSYIQDVESSLVSDLVENYFLVASTSYASIREADAVIVCVPTPLDEGHHPDLSCVITAMKQVAQFAHPGLLIVLESTSYPGTTREVVLPIIENANLRVGEEIFLCFSPERIDPGRKDWSPSRIPKIIGGITQTCQRVGFALYSSTLEAMIPVSSTDVAEMVKIFENSFRSINIAFANEMLMICEKLGLDIWEIIEAASTKPFGFMKFIPGPGVGGHCIPIDPLYLRWKLAQIGEETKLISLADQINSSMPQFWVGRIVNALKARSKAVKNSRILVLGLTYKRDVDDVRESPSLEIFETLLGFGGAVEYHDPFIPTLQVAGQVRHRIENFASQVGQVDCVVLATDHSIYRSMGLHERARLLINCRGRSVEGPVEEEPLVRGEAVALC